jgi:hypothetical protein
MGHPQIDKLDKRTGEVTSSLEEEQRIKEKRIKHNQNCK